MSVLRDVVELIRTLFRHEPRGPKVPTISDDDLRRKPKRPPPPPPKKPTPKA